MKTHNYIFNLSLVVLFPAIFISQTPKKFCESGEKSKKENNYLEAVDYYSKAIEADANYYKAYSGRAACYELLDKKIEAANDYKKAAEISGKDKELFYEAGRLYFLMNKYSDADYLLHKALEMDRYYGDAIDMELKTVFEMRNYDAAINISQMAIDKKRCGKSLYSHAVAHDSLGHIDQADKYYRQAKADDPKFMPTYAALAFLNLKQGKVDEALNNVTIVLTKEPDNMEAIYVRSMVYAAKKDMQSAINDITRVLLTSPSDKAYLQRGSYNEIMGQFPSALADYATVLKNNPNSTTALLRRAGIYEKLENYKSAIADLNKVSDLNKGNENVIVVVDKAQKRIFEAKREKDKPEIEISSLNLNSAKNMIRVAADKNDLNIKGKIKDANLIKEVNVNSGTVEFAKDSLNPEFTVQVKDVKNLNEITLSATDVYDNIQLIKYKIEKTESDKPIIAIEVPNASFENEIFVDNNNPDLFIKGKIRDASLIESIEIEDIRASFNPTNLNPDFTAQVRIADKNKLTFIVKDIYGNERNQTFSINRNGVNAGVDNPMGNTWIVFIENSHYLNFPSLEGPTKDVLAMKTALANYKITRILTKTDMTKIDMEKFFSIELRDLVKNNTINSLLIWYAGHGKYVSPTGYWVPSDGKTDDEFTYFGINNLKASMQSYQGKLVHTLVITDACESGATFLMAMRGGDDEKHCDNWELTKAKSSQVFTSAGFELASDNSQFTKTFVSCLNNNPDPCIPIDKIVKKVTSVVVGAGNQAPKFGKIKDLEDEGGTYFFIKK